jgi:hypothetical protein
MSYDRAVDGEPRSALDRRLRRVAVVAAALAIAAAVLGFVPDTLAYWESRWPDDRAPPVVDTMIAGGWTLVAWALLHAAIARSVYRRPSRRRAVVWFTTALVTTPLAYAVWAFGENFFLFDSIEPRGLGHVTLACAATAAVLLLVVLPLVALVSKSAPPDDAHVTRARARPARSPR